MKLRRLRKDFQKRYLYNNTELYQKTLKILFLYSNDNFFKLVINKKKYFNIFKNCYKTRIKNYCVISGRSRGILKKFKVSRIVFKILANDGLFCGLKKATW